MAVNSLFYSLSGGATFKSKAGAKKSKVKPAAPSSAVAPGKKKRRAALDFFGADAAEVRTASDCGSRRCRH